MRIRAFETIAATPPVTRPDEKTFFTASGAALRMSGHSSTPRPKPNEIARTSDSLRPIFCAAMMTALYQPFISVWVKDDLD